jgi:hypothetical protein
LAPFNWLPMSVKPPIPSPTRMLGTRPSERSPVLSLPFLFHWIVCWNLSHSMILADTLSISWLPSGSPSLERNPYWEWLEPSYLCVSWKNLE